MAVLLKTKPLLKQERISVNDECDLVVMQLGNVEVSLPYAAALQLSAWLRLHGRRAKRFAGDTSKNMAALGYLSASDG